MPGFAEAAGLIKNLRVVKAPVNPMDKCTIVSVYPKAIKDKKPTLDPGEFNVPAAKDDDISLLIVGPSSWWKEIDEEQPPVEIPVNSMQIAQSVVRDYCNGLLGCDMGELMPGIFFVPGPSNMKHVNEFSAKDYEVLKVEIRAKYATEIERAREKQKKWFAELVKLADIDWARTQGNPLSISDDARMAAERLGMKTKPWMQDFQSLAMVNCVACGALRNPSFPICGQCKSIVDKKKYDELGLAQAK